MVSKLSCDIWRANVLSYFSKRIELECTKTKNKEELNSDSHLEVTRGIVGCWPAWRVSPALLPTLLIHSKWICTDCKCPCLLRYICLFLLRASCLTLEIRCYEAKIEESKKKAGSHRESPPGTTLAWAASALPLSHNRRTTTNPQHGVQKLEVYAITWILKQFRNNCTRYHSCNYFAHCSCNYSQIVLKSMWLPILVDSTFPGLVIWNETTHTKKTWSTNSLLCLWLPHSCWWTTRVRKRTEECCRHILWQYM